MRHCVVCDHDVFQESVVVECFQSRMLNTSNKRGQCYLYRPLLYPTLSGVKGDTVKSLI